LEQFRLSARFNAWVNATLYGVVAELSDADYAAERGAFFGSIERTLNHLLVVDRIWFNRFFDRLPDGVTGLDQVLHAEFADLRAARDETDRWIVEVVDGLTPADLEREFAFTAMSTGQRQSMRGLHMLMTIFNHQTHHRGQVHCLLSQAGAKPPSLDLPIFLRAGGSATTIPAPVR